jgi:hypothetical protein
MNSRYLPTTLLILGIACVAIAVAAARHGAALL